MLVLSNRIDERFARIDERFARIEKRLEELDVIKALLIKHQTMLEKLEEAIREKIVFKFR
jgi:hypothetical protein